MTKSYEEKLEKQNEQLREEKASLEKIIEDHDNMWFYDLYKIGTSPIRDGRHHHIAAFSASIPPLAENIKVLKKITKAKIETRDMDKPDVLQTYLNMVHSLYTKLCMQMRLHGNTNKTECTPDGRWSHSSFTDSQKNEARLYLNCFKIERVDLDGGFND